MKKILISLFTIAIVGALIGGGVTALFFDTEEVGQNVFTAGTLDLEVGGGNPVSFTLGNMQPGDSQQYSLRLTNTGSIPGELSVEFGSMTNNDNGLTEPESDVDSTGGDGEGELGQYLEIVIVASTQPVPPGGTKTVLFWAPLNGVGGTTVDVPEQWGLLEAGELVELKITFRLPDNTGNIVQSDSVAFDIILHLEQA